MLRHALLETKKRLPTSLVKHVVLYSARCRVIVSVEALGKRIRIAMNNLNAGSYRRFDCSSFGLVEFHCSFGKCYLPPNGDQKSPATDNQSGHRSPFSARNP